VTDFFKKLTPKLITYGSTGVIKEWGGFRRHIPGLAAGNPLLMMLAFEKVLKAMRKDLGHSTFLLQDKDLSRLFVNDIDQLHKPSG